MKAATVAFKIKVTITAKAKTSKTGKATVTKRQNTEICIKSKQKEANEMIIPN